MSPVTFAEAEKLVQVEMTAGERAPAAGNWRVSLPPLYERRTGPRRLALEQAKRADAEIAAGATAARSYR